MNDRHNGASVAARCGASEEGAGCQLRRPISLPAAALFCTPCYAYCTSDFFRKPAVAGNRHSIDLQCSAFENIESVAHWRLLDHGKGRSVPEMP